MAACNYILPQLLQIIMNRALYWENGRVTKWLEIPDIILPDRPIKNYNFRVPITNLKFTWTGHTMENNSCKFSADEIEHS